MLAAIVGFVSREPRSNHGSQGDNTPSVLLVCILTTCEHTEPHKPETMAEGRRRGQGREGGRFYSSDWTDPIEELGENTSDSMTFAIQGFCHCHGKLDAI